MPDRIPTRTLGADGPEVGAIGLGCMGMSWAYDASQRDDARSVEVIHRALDLGVTFLDTSDMYGPFTNEELVGAAIAGRRDEVVLATKAGLVVEDVATYTLSRNASPEHLRRSIDGSLQRLGVDHVDLYQLHRVADDTPLEESWGALSEMVAAGKATRLGLSEVSVEQLEVAHAIHPVASVQSELSLWTRNAVDDGVLDWCAAHGAAFIPFSPLGRGYLTGAISAASFEDEDFRSHNPRFTREALEQNLAIVDAVRAVAAGLDATAGQVALAWTLAQGEHVVPIPGTKRVAYLEENAAAAHLRLRPEDLAALDALPAPVGDRY
jgi:aryl-alcohol dehydrogenase-like predicted oxidoreductase